MEKADIVWGGKACGVVQALSLADSGRIRALAVNEDPDDGHDPELRFGGPRIQ